MIKKLAIILCIFFLGLGLCLVIPSPYSPLGVAKDEFPPEEPIAFIPDRSENQQKCEDGTLYIKQSQFGYADSEVIDERCASLQAELARAAIDGDLDKMRSLLQKGASAQSPAFLTGDAYRPVIIAARRKQTGAVKLLLDNGADVNSYYSCCMTSQSLLMISVGMNDEPTTRLLLERKADIGFKEEFEGLDVFDEADRTNNPVITDMLHAVRDQSLAARIKRRARYLWHLFR